MYAMEMGSEMDRENIIDGLGVISRRRGEKITLGDIIIVVAAQEALKRYTKPAPEARYTKIGVLHRTSGRLTGGESVVSFHQEVFSIPLAVHGTLDVYMLDSSEPQREPEPSPNLECLSLSSGCRRNNPNVTRPCCALYEKYSSNAANGSPEK